jgi:pimeloyl-ACP methyl ester carboxylesterase
MTTPRAYALFAHCFTCSKDSLEAFHVSRELAAQGIGVLRFDFTGLGSSGGGFAATNFSSNIADLIAAVDFLSKKSSAPKILTGRSLGGTAILAAAPRIPEASAVVTIGAPCQPAHVRSLLGTLRAEFEARGEAEVSLAGRKFKIPATISRRSRGPRRPRVDCRVEKSPIGTQIFGAASHPKSFVSLDDADHLLRRKADCAFIAAVVSSWARRHVAD